MLMTSVGSLLWHVLVLACSTATHRRSEIKKITRRDTVPPPRVFPLPPPPHKCTHTHTQTLQFFPDLDSSNRCTFRSRPGSNHGGHNSKTGHISPAQAVNTHARTHALSHTKHKGLHATIKQQQQQQARIIDTRTPTRG